MKIANIINFRIFFNSNIFAEKLILFIITIIHTKNSNAFQFFNNFLKFFNTTRFFDEGQCKFFFNCYFNFRSMTLQNSFF